MIGFYSTQPRYRDHLAPVWDALGLAVRGSWPGSGRGPVVVASYGDLRRVRRSRPVAIAHLEHGAGQSYSNDHPSYPGGRDHQDVSLFMVPNEHAAERWRNAYPRARVEVVGSPRLDSLPSREPGPGPVVAVSFHGSFAIVPETQSAFPAYARYLPALAARHRVLGHAHPLFMPSMGDWYRRHGIEVVEDFTEVCRRADLYVCDNSSTLFEFASTGRPVVVLNIRQFRREVQHHLRFWNAADVGVQCEPEGLQHAVELALTDPPAVKASRERALDTVYGVRTGSADLAARTLTDWSEAWRC